MSKITLGFCVQLKMPFLASALGFLVWVGGATDTAAVPNHSGTFLLQGGCELWKKKNKKDLNNIERRKH